MSNPNDHGLNPFNMVHDSLLQERKKTPLIHVANVEGEVAPGMRISGSYYVDHDKWAFRVNVKYYLGNEAQYIETDIPMNGVEGPVSMVENLRKTIVEHVGKKITSEFCRQNLRTSPAGAQIFGETPLFCDQTKTKGPACV